MTSGLCFRFLLRSHFESLGDASSTRKPLCFLVRNCYNKSRLGLLSVEIDRQHGPLDVHGGSETVRIFFLVKPTVAI